MCACSHFHKCSSHDRVRLGVPKLLLLSTTLLIACGGSVKAGAHAQASGDAGSDGEASFDMSSDSETAWETNDHSLSEDDTNRTAQASGAQGGSSTNGPALLGARHDLVLKQGSPERCRCLAVVVGEVAHSGFVWTGERPVIDNRTQRVIGLSSDDIICTDSTTGASYTGYEVKNGDVIVKIEAAVAGRPVTQGAIIPRPVEGKQIYLEPVGSIPYGKPLSGQSRCALGR